MNRQASVFLVGVSGNLMVVVTVRGTKSLHTTTNCYLVSLALADLITLVSSVPQEVGGSIVILSQKLSHQVLSYHILGDLWVWGSLGCSLMVFCQFLAMNSSALSLTAFTIERYIAICHPMKAQVGPRGYNINPFPHSYYQVIYEKTPRHVCAILVTNFGLCFFFGFFHRCIFLLMWQESYVIYK